MERQTKTSALTHVCLQGMESTFGDIAFVLLGLLSLLVQGRLRGGHMATDTDMALRPEKPFGSSWLDHFLQEVIDLLLAWSNPSAHTHTGHSQACWCSGNAPVFGNEREGDSLKGSQRDGFWGSLSHSLAASGPGSLRTRKLKGSPGWGPRGSHGCTLLGCARPAHRSRSGGAIEVESKDHWHFVFLSWTLCGLKT